MISLVLSTCINRLVIGIYENKNQIYFECEQTNNDLSGKVLEHLKKALEKNNLSVEKIDEIYVANGPGSFTGIRIGVTIAKTLAWATKCKIYTVSELMLEATTETNKKYIVPMIDARRGYIYTAMYDSNLKCIYEDQYVEEKEFINNVLEKYDAEDIEFVSFNMLDKTVLPQIKPEKILNLKFFELNPHEVNPNYLKKTEAEEKLGAKVDK